MRNLLVILLLFCLLLNMGGYLFWVQHHQRLLKKEMRMRLRAGINRELQDEFEFTLVGNKPADPSFRWEEEKEFQYKGKMYDVIDQEIVDGKLRIRCIQDNKEESLLKQFAKMQQKEGSKPDKAKRAILLLATFILRMDTPSAPPAEAASQLYYEHYLSTFTPVAKEVITPPPRA